MTSQAPHPATRMGYARTYNAAEDPWHEDGYIPWEEIAPTVTGPGLGTTTSNNNNNNYQGGMPLDWSHLDDPPSTAQHAGVPQHALPQQQQQEPWADPWGLWPDTTPAPDLYYPHNNGRTTCNQTRRPHQ